jgi:ABC-type glycerol-3-phosphate transport system substrate-binding protein
MKNFGLKNFIIALFVMFAIIAFLIFAGVINVGDSRNTAAGNVVVWGTETPQTMSPYIEQVKTKNIKVSYQRQDKDTYESTLVNAIAAGKGPDIFMIPHELALRHSDKIFEIPYSSFPKSRYEQTYIDAAEVFLTDTGVIALPLSVDPLVMYYNRNLVSSSFQLRVPEYWDEIFDFVEDINAVQDNGEIEVSGLAMGTYDNLEWAKDIISLLLLQNNNSIVRTDNFSGKKISSLSFTEASLTQSRQAMEFFTSFANRQNQNYSWNEALPSSRDMFVAGDLAIYIGRASELSEIQAKNPNLDFNISLIPQIRDEQYKTTVGSLQAIAINKQSSNINPAITVAAALAGNTVAGDLAEDLERAPARRDLLNVPPSESYKTLIFDSAIISRAWFDPSPEATGALFRTMVRSINSGAQSIVDAVQSAHVDLNTALDQSINTILPDRNRFEASS